MGREGYRYPLRSDSVGHRRAYDECVDVLQGFCLPAAAAALWQSFPSPLTYIRRQKKFLGGFIERDVTYVIVFDDGTDLTGVRCTCPVMHMSELVDFLKGLDGVDSEAEIKGAFDAFRLAVANGGTRWPVFRWIEDGGRILCLAAWCGHAARGRTWTRPVRRTVG